MESDGIKLINAADTTELASYSFLLLNWRSTKALYLDVFWDSTFIDSGSIWIPLEKLNKLCSLLFNTMSI